MYWDRSNFEHTLAAADYDAVEFDALMLPPRMALPWHLELMKALIEDAIVQIDLEWINRDSEDVLSFANCCEALALDPSAVRRAPNERLIGKKKAPKKKITWSKLLAEIEDVPGVEYTHRYGDCEMLADCGECRQRYNHRYSKLYRRGIRLRRRAFTQPPTNATDREARG